MTRYALTLLVSVVFADYPMLRGQDVDEVFSRLEKKYESIRDLSVSFTQVIRFGVTQATQSFDGKLWMKKGNKYRIELEQQTIVTDGHSVWTYSELTKQVFIDKFRNDPNAITPDKILVNVPGNYFANIIGKEKVDGVETLVLKLIPKERNSLTKSIKAWLNTSEWLMAKVEVLDVSDNQTTYLTKDFKINTGIPDRFFQFTIPPDVDVVDFRTSP